jgi:DtxR family Mn-dependent transcriptional regulator
MVSELTSSQEDYLKAIYQLAMDNKVARVRDIAKRMNVKMPTVISALKHLSSKELINYDPHQFITLTNSGEKQAGEIVRRHEIVIDFLSNILNVDGDRAEANACRIEHAFDEKVMEQFVNFLEFMENCPRGGNDLIEGFRNFCESHDMSANCKDCCQKAVKFASERDEALKQSAAVSLAEMPQGAKAQIVKIKGDGEIKKRLIEMGITKGAFIEVEHIAPLGDPLGVRVKGYHLSLRKEEASKVIVHPGM